MKKIILCATLLLAIAACKTKKTTSDTAAAPPTPPTPVEAPAAATACGTQGMSFSEIKPILIKNCTSCHDDFGDYQIVKQFAKDGSLLATIKHQMPYKPMPKDAPQLAQAYIDLIDCWVKNGMKE